MAQRPDSFRGARITDHALTAMVRRGFANTRGEAYQRILNLLDWPGIVSEARTTGRDQWRLQEASSTNYLTVIVDVKNWSVPTAYVSGHDKGANE